MTQIINFKFNIVTISLRGIQLLLAPSKRAAVEGQGKGEDIINALPRNVVDGILELLPVHQAAKISILSRKWRYIWASHPHLVLNNFFCKKLIAKSESIFTETVDVILLQHIGDIVKFYLDVSGVQFSSFTHIDRWMLYVTRNGVKELTLNMSRNVTTTYKVPSCIFNCQTLTHLVLLNCIIKPPNSILGFNNLIFLILERITFVPAEEFCVINVPLVVTLALMSCKGTQYLNIVVSTRLKCLSLCGIHGNLILNRFANCKKLTNLLLLTDSPIHSDEMSTYEKFIFSLSTLETLTLSSFVLELLSTGKVTKGLPLTLNYLCHLTLHIHFGNTDQISYSLELIKSSGNLSKLQIWVCRGDNAETVLKYLDTPACLDQPLNKLKNVAVHRFKGSKAELLFVKLLFACTPSLVRMNIKPTRVFDSEEERNIIIELMRFPRASPKAELFYTPYSV